MNILVKPGYVLNFTTKRIGAETGDNQQFACIQNVDPIGQVFHIVGPLESGNGVAIIRGNHSETGWLYGYIDAKGKTCIKEVVQLNINGSEVDLTQKRPTLVAHF